MSWSARMTRPNGRSASALGSKVESALRRRAIDRLRRSEGKRALANTNDQSSFTFIIEKEGSTIIEQVAGRDIMDAVIRWSEISETHPGNPLEIADPTPIEGVRNVWCIARHDPAGIFYIAHVVATQGE